MGSPQVKREATRRTERQTDRQTERQTGKDRDLSSYTDRQNTVLAEALYCRPENAVGRFLFLCLLWSKFFAKHRFREGLIIDTDFGTEQDIMNEDSVHTALL